MAHVLAIRYLFTGGDSTILNLGTGKGYSVYDVISAVEKVANKPVPIKKIQSRQGDPPILIAAANEAKRKLNWTPEYTNIHSIIETAWKWYCNYFS